VLIRFLTLLMMCCSCVLVYAEQIQPDDGADTGWVEERISPTTTAVEKMFSPVSRWLESKIQSDSDDTFQPEIETSQSVDGTQSQVPQISAERASYIALQQHKGHVLKIQLKHLPQAHYVVRLLTREGKITNLRIDANNGKLIPTPPAVQGDKP